MNKRLIAIGEALIDFIPDKSGCEFYEVTGFSPKLGGAPANVCGAFARLGGAARLITQLGCDPFGDKIMRELAEYDIDTSCISQTDKANTALAFVSLAENGNRTFSFYRKPSADMLLSPEQIKDEWFEDVFVLHFCSISLGDFPMKQSHYAAIEATRKSGGMISFDPNLRFQLWDDLDKLKKTVLEFIPLSDILKISDEELEFITGESDFKKGIHTVNTDDERARFEQAKALAVKQLQEIYGKALKEVGEANAAIFEIGICGELGADTTLTETFLRMGVDELSVSPAFVLKVRDTVRNVDLSKA